MHGWPFSTSPPTFTNDCLNHSGFQHCQTQHLLSIICIYIVFIYIMSWINIHRLEGGWILGSDSSNPISHPCKCVAGVCKAGQFLGKTILPVAGDLAFLVPSLVSVLPSSHHGSQKTLSYISTVPLGVVTLVGKLLSDLRVPFDPQILVAYTQAWLVTLSSSCYRLR